MLADALTSGRPHSLLDDERTKITEHTIENPGMSAHRVAQVLCHKFKTVRTMLKKREGYFPHRISLLYELKLEDYTPCYNYCDWVFEEFGYNVETMKHGFIR